MVGARHMCTRRFRKRTRGFFSLHSLGFVQDLFNLGVVLGHVLDASIGNAHAQRCHCNDCDDDDYCFHDFFLGKNLKSRSTQRARFAQEG